jgi:hypothetical protein
MSSMPDAVPHMEFRLLQGGEMELATALAAAQAGAEDPAREGWGLGTTGAAPLNCEAFGLLVQGSVAGVLWLFSHPQGIAEIKALVLSKGRWGTGLIGWMLDNAAAVMGERGLKGLFVNLSEGGERLGELLEDAGFRGPQLADPGYPRGRWIRSAQRLAMPE